MSFTKNLAFLTVAFALFATPFFNTAAEAKTKYKPHRRHLVSKQVYHPWRPSNQVYNSGWRHRSRGWDNTCLDLPYLPSEFACDAK
jgi:hypothetical protein